MPKFVTKNCLYLPLLPLREEVIFPMMTIPLMIGRPSSIKTLEYAEEHGGDIFAITQIQPSFESPNLNDLCSIGVMGELISSMRMRSHAVKAVFEAKRRAKLIRFEEKDGCLFAYLEVWKKNETQKAHQVADQLKELLLENAEIFSGKISIEKIDKIEKLELEMLPDFLAPLFDLSKEQKFQLIEEINISKRLELILKFLQKELEITQMGAKLQNQVKKSVAISHKEDYLHQQLRNIQKELGHVDEGSNEIEELKKQIYSCSMPEKAKEVALKELKKLKMTSATSAEANVIRNYLEWLVNMPWTYNTEEVFNLQQAEKILNEDHYGLFKIKDQILEYIAVATLKKSLKGHIICFVGPPGVGKTSLAKSIARALNREFARMSLGGVRDEAEIRGHRRTYIGAMPGKIIQSLRKIKSTNPVFLLDEIDKLYQNATSAPASALLEVLDPEQNQSFVDHYLEIDYDLSSTLFICTANSTNGIPLPLLDRMEVIPLSGYTELEKYHIARQFILPKQSKEHGLKPRQLSMKKTILMKIIERYTREAGVRDLERQIGKICRKVATQLTKENQEHDVVLSQSKLKALLGPPTFHTVSKENTNKVGVTTGLSVTALGGEIMMVEISMMSGDGKLIMTGKLGDVLKESIETAFSFVHSQSDHLSLPQETFEQHNFHVHLPEGSIPKDGPSVGVALICSLVSTVAQMPVRNDVAVTGEINLRGKVLKVGGVKDKLLAAKRSGIFEVILPKENEPDLIEVPEEILEHLQPHFITNAEEALEIAFLQKLEI